MFTEMILINLFYDDGEVHLVLSPAAALILLIVASTAVFGLLRPYGHRWQVVELDIPLGGIGQFKVRRTNEVVRVAHQAWTELVTRKAALPFDEENDVIREVYDSWHQLFRELRSLAKSVPAEQLRHGSPAKELVDVLVRALNDGLRPHLTRWQARFRSWDSWDQAQPGNDGLTPQARQRRFPDYDDLHRDLLEVNAQLVGFASALNQIVHGDKERQSGG